MVETLQKLQILHPCHALLKGHYECYDFCSQWSEMRFSVSKVTNQRGTDPTSVQKCLETGKMTNNFECRNKAHWTLSVYKGFCCFSCFKTIFVFKGYFYFVVFLFGTHFVLSDHPWNIPGRSVPLFWTRRESRNSKKCRETGKVTNSPEHRKKG